MGEDPFKLEPTPEENNQALFEAEKIVCAITLAQEMVLSRCVAPACWEKMSAQAGVRQYDDDLKLDVPEDEQEGHGRLGFWHGRTFGAHRKASLNSPASTRRLAACANWLGAILYRASLGRSLRASQVLDVKKTRLGFRHLL